MTADGQPAPVHRTIVREAPADTFGCMSCMRRFPIAQARSCQSNTCAALPYCGDCYAEHMRAQHGQGILPF